jgi:ABC-type transporter MlaC component
MILDSTFLNNGEKFQVSYKYYKPKKPKKLKQNWLIYDVILSGVSIIKTDKAQFKEALQGSSIQDLMEQLEK